MHRDTEKINPCNWDSSGDISRIVKAQGMMCFLVIYHRERPVPEFQKHVIVLVWKLLSNQERGEAGTLRKEDLVLLIEWLKLHHYGKKEVRKLCLYSGILRKYIHLIWGSPCDYGWWLQLLWTPRGQWHSVEAELRSCSSLPPPAPLGAAIRAHFPWLAQHTSGPFITGLWSDARMPGRYAFGLGALWLLNLTPAKRMRPTPWKERQN